MTSDELKKRIREIIHRHVWDKIDDHFDLSALSDEDYDKIEESLKQAIYDLMLELIKDLPNSAYLENNGLRHEPVNELRKLIKEARND